MIGFLFLDAVITVTKNRNNTDDTFVHLCSMQAYGSQLIAVLQQRQPLNLNDVPQVS